MQSMARTFAMIFGAFFILLGVSGFVSNPLIGAGALFAAAAASTALHLVFGALLLIIAFRSGGDARPALRIVGAATFLFGLIGLLTVPPTGGFLFAVAYTNGAMNWLHIAVGIAIFFSPRFR